MNLFRLAVLCVSGGLALSAGAQSNVPGAVQQPVAAQETSVRATTVSLPDGSSVDVETSTVIKARPAPQPEKAVVAPRKTLIVVDNRAGAELNATVSRFEDEVAARAGGDAFEIISREESVRAQKVYDVGAGETPRNTTGTTEDRKLMDNSTVLRMAQNTGADYVLVVTLDSLASETRAYNNADLGVKTKNKVYTLRAAYKLLDGGTGGMLGGLPVKASRTIRESGEMTIDVSDLSAELMEQAATQIAKDMLKKADSFRQASSVGEIEVAIHCAARDLQGNELSLPDIRLTEGNRLATSTSSLPVQVVANIEVDGLVMGSTPATIKIKPGIHKLRLTRAGFEDAVMTIKASAGMELEATMQMSADGFARWMASRAFLNALDKDRALTDATVELIRADAQRLRQSGFRIDHRSDVKADHKSDVKIDAKEMPDIKISKSIYSVD